MVLVPIENLIEEELQAGGETSWHLLADCPDAFRIVIEFLDVDAKKALRQTCQSTRAAVDAGITQLHLKFPAEEGEEDAPQSTQSYRPLEDETALQARRAERFACSPAVNNFPGVGQSWHNADSVRIEDCPFSALTLRFIDGASSRWPLLRQLQLINCRMGLTTGHFDLMAALTATPWPRLETLELCGCALDSISVGMLAGLQAPRLNELDLSDNRITTLVGLSTALWPCLDTLAVCRNQVLNVIASIETLIDTFPLLDDLDLSGVSISATDMTALAQADWPALRWLSLSGCRMIDTALGPLADEASLAVTTGELDTFKGWQALERLDLSGNLFRSAAAVQYLGNIAALVPNLRALDISTNQNLRTQSLKALKLTSWPALEYFKASNMVLVTADIEGLTRALMPRLRCLTLRNSTMSWNAVDQLATGQWPNLRKVDLGGANGVHLRRAGPSLANAAWPRLKWLVLRQSSARIKTVNRKALLQLKERWPELMIRCE